MNQFVLPKTPLSIAEDEALVRRLRGPHNGRHESAAEIADRATAANEIERLARLKEFYREHPEFTCGMITDILRSEA
jgi:hypothetical protein